MDKERVPPAISRIAIYNTGGPVVLGPDQLATATGTSRLHCMSATDLLLTKRNCATILLETNMTKKDVKQGTLALMVLKTLDVLGALHGYGIARRIEQISGDLLAVNQGTLVSRPVEIGAGGCDQLGVGHV